MSKASPYDVLGVPRDASQDEIRSAYRRLARRHHPDVNPDDPSAEEKFKEIGEAYGILSDEQKRARFDQYGTTDDVPQDFFGGGQGGGIEDIFNMFFGGGGGFGGAQGRRNGAINGEDIRADVELKLLDVLNGLETEVTVRRHSVCGTCNGNRTEDGSQPETCPNCKGAGQVTQIRQTMLGQMRTSMPCNVCRGEGVTVKNPCKTCRGSGLVLEDARVHLNIPAGVENGATMHVPGQGSEGLNGGRPGDLYVYLEVADDKRFQRQGQHLFTTLELTFAQAAMGDKFEIEGLDDSIEVNVPAATQPGTRIPVRGAGLPPLQGGRRGDLILTATIKVPSKLSDAQVKLIKELAEVSGERIPEGEDGGFLGLFKKKK